jgi:hypothetical protein
VQVVKVDGVVQPAGTTVKIDGVALPAPATGEQVIEIQTPTPPAPSAAIEITPETIDQVERTPDGKSYHLSAGVYRPFTLRNKKDVRVFGDAPVLVEGATSLHGHAITVRDCERVSIDGLQLTGGNAGVGLYGCKSCEVRNCKAFANKNWGVFTSFCNDCKAIDNVCFDNKGQHGIYFSNDSQRPTITGNVCIGHDRSGIQCNGDKYADGEGVIRGALIAKNIVAANKIGMNMDGLVDSRIENNVIHNGITLFKEDGAEASSRNRLRGNTMFVLDGERHAVALRGGATGNDFEGELLYVARSLPRWFFPISRDDLSTFAGRSNLFYGPSQPIGAGAYGKTGEMLPANEGSVVR